MTVAPALLAFVLLQSAPVEPEAAPITVMAEQLKRIRISPGVTIRKGVVTLGQCKIKRSSGDAELDALACEAVRVCAGRPQPKRSLFNQCVKSEAEDLMYGLIEERRLRDLGEGPSR